MRSSARGPGRSKLRSVRLVVEAARLREFARACLEMSKAGRLALAVLDGGLFAPRRALELAAHVVAGAGAFDAAKGVKAG